MRKSKSDHVEEFEGEKTDGRIIVRIFQEEDSSYCDPRGDSNLGKMVCWHKRYTIGDKHDYRDPTEFMVDLFRDYIAARSKVSTYDIPHPDDVPEAAYKRYKQFIVDTVFENYAIRRIRGYEHSGMTISTSGGYPYNDVFDSGWLGYIYCSLEDARKAMMVPEFNWDTVIKPGDSLSNPKAEKDVTFMQRIEELLDGEVDTYDEWMRGEVYYINAYVRIPDEEGFWDEDSEVIDLDSYTKDHYSCGGFIGWDYAKEEAKSMLDDAENAWLKYEDNCKNCEACQGRGFNPEFLFGGAGKFVIRCCKACRRFFSDAEAQKACDGVYQVTVTDVLSAQGAS